MMGRTRKFFVTVTSAKGLLTVVRHERNEARLLRRLADEFKGASFGVSECTTPRPIDRPLHQLEADWEAEGKRIALEGMDLPDGAYFAMADELGIEP